MKDCNRHILEAIALSEELIDLADKGESEAEDNSCIVLFGIIRDCAYKIRHHTLEERQKHIDKGIWFNIPEAG